MRNTREQEVPLPTGCLNEDFNLKPNGGVFTSSEEVRPEKNSITFLHILQLRMRRNHKNIKTETAIILIGLVY